jgi:hypothetical protein
VFSCDAFVDRLIEARPGSAPPPPEADKPAAPATPDELAAWLAAFSTPAKEQR